MKFIEHYIPTQKSIKDIMLRSEEGTLENIHICIRFSDAKSTASSARELKATIKAISRLQHKDVGITLNVVDNAITLYGNVGRAAGILAADKLMSEEESNRLKSKINDLIGESFNKSMEEMVKREKLGNRYDPTFLARSNPSKVEIKDNELSSSPQKK